MGFVLFEAGARWAWPGLPAQAMNKLQVELSTLATGWDAAEFALTAGATPRACACVAATPIGPVLELEGA